MPFHDPQLETFCPLCEQTFRNARQLRVHKCISYTKETDMNRLTHSTINLSLHLNEEAKPTVARRSICHNTCTFITIKIPNADTADNEIIIFGTSEQLDALQKALSEMMVKGEAE